MKNPQFQVERKAFLNARLHEMTQDEFALDKGDVLLKIDKFGYTSNNVTYAVAGDLIGYWKFFPIAENDDKWGVIPVWGFADVTESKHESVAVGDRFFGYFPPASHLRIHPVHANSQRIIDGTPHRIELPAAYNTYQRVVCDTEGDAITEDERMVLYPLHLTSYFLYDYLLEQKWYGAEQILVLSASGKTSTGLGYALQSDQSSPRTIGLTSRSNLPIIQPLNIYDTCYSYEQIDQIESKPTLIVDMSGNAKLLQQLIGSLGEQVKFILKVGLTHWRESSMVEDPSEVTPSYFFFAPTHIARRLAEWGPEEFVHRTDSFLETAAARTRSWMTFRRITGLDELMEIHPKICQGEIPANEAIVVNL